jgi:hypothetical protein
MDHFWLAACNHHMVLTSASPRDTDRRPKSLLCGTLCLFNQTRSEHERRTRPGLHDAHDPAPPLLSLRGSLSGHRPRRCYAFDSFHLRGHLLRQLEHARDFSRVL